MPTYEYACTSCATRLEVVQRFTDAPLTECPECGGPLRKVFAPVGVVFKGSGFYKTDTRTSSKPASAASAGAPAPESSSSSTPTSSSTPASSTDSSPSSGTTPAAAAS